MIKFAASSLSLTKLLTAHEIRIELVREVIDLLTPGLKRFDIIWNSKVFQASLLKGGIPKSLLEKFEILLETAVNMNWRLPASLVEELDLVIENIESFHPPFRKSLSLTSKTNGKTIARSRLPASLKRK